MGVGYVQAFIASGCIGVTVLGSLYGCSIFPSFQTNEVGVGSRPSLSIIRHVVQVLKPKLGRGTCMRLAFYDRPYW